MHSGAAVDVLGESGSAARFAGMAEALLEGGIDDLAKYRIILHLLQQPQVSGDATYFARSLGFHCPERTAVLLAELATAGLLWREERPGSAPCFGLPPDSGLRQRLQAECLADPHSPEYEELLRGLAQRSVARAKGQAARMRKGAA